MRWFQSRLLLLILLALLIVSVIPLTFMGTIGLDRYEELAQKTIDLNASQLNENSLDAMESQAANTANQLAIFLRQRDTDLRMLSNLPRIPEAYLEFAQSRQGEIWTLTPDTKTEIRFNLPLYREVAFINLAGQEELKIETECQSYPADCSVMVSSNVINVSNPADTTFGTEEYFIKAQQLRAGEIYAGRPIGYYIPSVVSFKGAQLLSGQRYEGIIRYITPVYENEAKIGYVTLALDHTHILEFIHHTDPTADRPLPAINPGSNNFVYIISSDGSAIAHVEHSNIAGVDRFGNPVPPFNETQPNGPGNFYEMGFLNPVFPEIMQTATQRSQGAFSRIELRNDPRLTRSLAYSVVPYFTGENYDDALGFGLVIVSADFNARSVGSDVLSTQLGRDLQELIGEMGGLLLATMAVVVVIALLFAQRVVAPIRTVTRYAAIMEQRRLIDTEISVLKRKRGRSEVNQLARTFGTMTETVQQREAEIAELLSQTDEALARRVKELATLEEIGQQLTATLDLSLVFDFATRVLVERTAAEGVHLVVFPPDEESEPHIAIAGRVLSPEESSEALRIPLKHGDEKIGHFELFAEGYVFDENEQSFARQLADWVSVAINNARLFEQIQEQQRQLEITNKEVTEANRLKSEFLAVMSHELRTPLNAIIGFLGIMLMSGQLNERNTFLAGRARANSDRLLRLINDILDISRIEAGRLQLYPVDVEVRELVRRLKDQMSIFAEEKGLHMKIQIDDSVPVYVRIDEDALTKILTNLLSNGFKFTENGHVALNMHLEHDNLVIAVSDTGIGIPAHMRDIIFESFRQVDSSMTRQHGGSGLGLAIVRHLCTAMQGTVIVDSKVGRGSTFTVVLPLTTAYEKEKSIT